MMLKCAKCGAKNYLDPYPFWNFKGKTKCAGCDTYYAVEVAVAWAGNAAGAGIGYMPVLERRYSGSGERLWS